MAAYRPRVSLWYKNSISDLQDIRVRSLYFFDYWFSFININISVPEPCQIYFLVIIESLVIMRHYSHL